MNSKMKKALLFPFFLLVVSCTSSKPHPDDDKLPIMPKAHVASSQGSLSHVLYMIQTGKTKEAVDALLAMKEENPYVFHEGTLQMLGATILEQGSKSRDPQDLLTSLYGVGISHDARNLYIAEKALQFDEPQLALVAVSVIASFDTEEAHELLAKAMKSNYVFVRLEAAYWLSIKRASDAHAQLVALMSKVDPEIHELFPRLFAMEGSDASTYELRKLLYDQSEHVRRETILALGEATRDDFIDDIIILAKEPSMVQQEAACFALGLFCDERARPVLEKLTASNFPTVRLAAHRALYDLGSETAKDYITAQAKEGDPFAIYALGYFDDDGRVLVELMQHDDVQIRINASLALLERKDSRSLDGLGEILLDTHKDYTFHPATSHGGSLRFWKVTASSSQAYKKHPQFFEVSLRMREEVLTSCLELPEDDFLEVAEAILECHQRDLVPLTVHLLENLRSERAIKLLKKYELQLGAPHIRAWCCLGLYRLQEAGPYTETVLKIVEKNEDKEVFKARPVLPWRMRQEDTRYELTLQESCALLIESFEALAQRQDEKGIEILLKAIRDGNPHNRYTLAGLLMRSSL